MTLKNLLGISLDAVPPDKVLVTKLIAAAQRNIADLPAHVRAWLQAERPDLV